MIELKNVTKSYGNRTILENVNTTIHSGDVIAVIGPSGSGKTTLLNCINMLSPPTSGQVFFEGQDITSPNCNLRQIRHKLGMVFQSFNLFGHMTVVENVMLPQVDLLGRSRQEAYDRAMEHLQMVGLADRALRYPEALSGGQKQRVAIARALAMEPEVILFDEPTSALDPTLVGEVAYIIKKLAAQGRTMVIVTHEIRFAREVSNRVFYMDEKSIYEDGPTEQIFTAPQREKTQRFIRQLKCLDIIIDSCGADYVSAMQSIENYGDRLALPDALVRKAQLLFEEFCLQTLLPALGQKPHIHVIFSYQEEEKTLRMTVRHSGTAMLEAPDMDPISRKLIESLSREIPLNEEAQSME